MRKRILIISPGIPYPPVDGHKLKIYNLLRLLKIDYDIDLVVITSEAMKPDAEQFLKESCKGYKIFKYSKLRFFLNIFGGFFNRKTPFQVLYYTFTSVAKYLAAHSSKYDYVFFNIIRTTGYFPLFDRNKIIVDMVDSIGINYLRSRKRTESFLHRTIYNLEASRLISYERKIVSEAKATLFVNKFEAASYSKWGVVRWLPNGVNEKLLQFSFKNNDYKNFVCFFGAMFYQPNIDAALWFIKYVLPKLDERITFCILGQSPSSKILKAQQEHKNVIVTGFLDNPYEILQSALCSVAPMQTGGGIQNKILESMALGQITITNKLGFHPITGAINKEHILLAQTPDEFVSIINRLFTGDKSLEKIRDNARQFIRRTFSWESYKIQLKEILES